MAEEGSTAAAETCYRFNATEKWLRSEFILGTVILP